MEMMKKKLQAGKCYSCMRRKEPQDDQQREKVTTHPELEKTQILDRKQRESNDIASQHKAGQRRSRQANSATEHANGRRNEGGNMRKRQKAT